MRFLKKLLSVRPAVDDHLLRVLGETRIFENLSLADLEKIADEIVLRDFSPGERIFSQGDDGDGLYVIDIGTVDVFIKTRDGEKKLVSLFDRDFFGEMALIDDLGKRSASVISHNQCRCLFLPKNNFNNLLASSHVTAAKVLFKLCRVLTRRLARTSSAAVGEK